MKSLLDLKCGDQVKLVVSMVGRSMTVKKRITDPEGRVQLFIGQNWYYADTGNAVNKSLAYITAIEGSK